MFETKIDEQAAEQIRQRIARKETTRKALADEYCFQQC